MSKNDHGLAGRVVVVTGAGSGIGAATVDALRRREAIVIAVDVDDTALTRFAGIDGVTPVIADVRDPGHARKVVEQTLLAHGHVDAIVANAGIGHAGEFVEMTPERIDDVLSVNARAPVLLARAALPSMLEQGRGAIVLVSSIVGVLLLPGESVYSASKAALEAFADVLREELHGSGVTVSIVRPAVVATRFFDSRGEPYARRWPRPVGPERLAATIVRAIETGARAQTVPRWFAVPMRIRALAPGLYRLLARRFG